MEMNKHIGTSFDAFLSEAHVLEEVTVAAMKRVMAWRMSQRMKAQRTLRSALLQRVNPRRN
jgi:hypothetical protein